MKKHSKKAAFKNLIRFSLLILCGAVLGFNIYSANANSLVGNKLPTPFGYGAAVVLSGSMEPELSKGDLIIVKETNSYNCEDIVVFQDGNSLVVHRIIEKSDEEVITKGDANNTDDGAIAISRIKGEVVFSVPYAGTAIEFIKSPVGTILIIALAILLLEIPRFKERKKDTEEIEKIKEEIRKLKNDEN